jgi:DNA-binding response OmpR family regulator
LSLLAQNEGKAMNPEYLYEKIWGQPMSGDNQAIQIYIDRRAIKEIERALMAYADGEAEPNTLA